MFEKIIEMFFSKKVNKDNICVVKEDSQSTNKMVEKESKKRQAENLPKSTCLSLYFYKNKGLNVVEREFYNSKREYFAR